MAMIQYQQNGWHVVQPTKFSRLVGALRQWLLVLVVAWLAGWGAVDMMLRYGGDGSSLQMASVEAPVRG
jgi:hypothetical protein